MAAENEQATKSWGSGWRLGLYIFGTTLISCLALIANMGFMYVIFTGVVGYIYEPVALYVGQFILYVGPYLLLFLEWRLWDSMADPFRGY